jgi:xylulokinase
VLALAAPAGAGGMALVPYLEGERTPNKPDATGAIHGLRLETATPAYLARAAVEGMICGLADAVDAVRALGTPVERIILIGGAARSEAVREIASAVLGLPVTVPEPGEYVARGAARQAAWVLAGGDEPPVWELAGAVETRVEATPQVRERYAQVREMTAPRP